MEKQRKIIAVIPARGGSKGIPYKNIIDLCGKPLLAYSIDAAKDSKHINEVYVSTEDEKIASVAQELGSKVVKRPLELATDDSSSDSVLLHFAETIDFDVLVFLQCTSPLVKSKYIDAGIEMLLSNENDYESVFSVYEEHWMGKWDKNGEAVGWDSDNRPKRRQDLEKVYAENGAFYIITKSDLLKYKFRYGKKRGLIEMPFLDSFQVDSHEDLELIGKILSLRK